MSTLHDVVYHAGVTQTMPPADWYEERQVSCDLALLAADGSGLALTITMTDETRGNAPAGLRTDQKSVDLHISPAQLPMLVRAFAHLYKQTRASLNATLDDVVSGRCVRTVSEAALPVGTAA